MASFEEEAFARAQQMNRRQPFYHNNQQQNQKASPKQEQTQKPEPKPEPVENHEENIHNSSNLLGTLFKNKEQSLILLLLVLLMDENADPTLLLALVYLLI